MENSMDYIHNGKRCSILQDLLDVLCYEYKLTRIRIIYKVIPVCYPGKFLSDELAIEINRVYGSYDDFYIKVVYHEFRHYWQMKNILMCIIGG